MGVLMGSRAKLVLTSNDLHRLLGLPADVRVVNVERSGDPVRADVIIEGDGLPAEGMWPGGVSNAQMAYEGICDADMLWHPINGDGSEAPRLTWGGWRPGDARRPGDGVQAIAPSSAGATE
jgi:hypothetical protein